jgi:hypothetical protein
MEFDIYVSGRATRFADFTDATQVNALPRLDTGGDVNIEGRPSADTTVSRTGRARCCNYRSVPSTRATRSCRDDVSQQTANLALH